MNDDIPVIRARLDAADGILLACPVYMQEQALRPSLLSLLAFKIQQLAWGRADPSSHDYAYWRNQGWLAPGRTFYIAHRAGRANVVLARLVGAVVAWFMIR